MKKIWFILVMVCSVCAFTACSDDDENKGDVTPECPVKNVTLDKATAKVGDQLVLSGEGFAAGAKLLLEKDSHQTTISDWKVAADGKQIAFTVPEAEAGAYKLILDQDGKWTLDIVLTIEKAVEKKLKGIGINIEPAVNFTLNYADERLISITQTTEGKAPYDYFTFTYGHDSVYIVVDQSGTFPRAQGHIVLGGKQVKTCNGNAWTYNADGYLEKAIIGTRIPQNISYTYEGGNLTGWSSENMGQVTKYDLKYEGTRPDIKGVDVAALYAAVLSGSWQNPLFGAHLLGVTGEASAQLPSVINGTKSEWNFDENDQMVEIKTPVSSNFTDFSVDTDGYITKAVLDDKIKFNKELIITFTWE